MSFQITLDARNRENVLIDKGDGTFISMLKEVWDNMTEAEQNLIDNSFLARSARKPLSARVSAIFLSKGF